MFTTFSMKTTEMTVVAMRRRIVRDMGVLLGEKRDDRWLACKQAMTVLEAKITENQLLRCRAVQGRVGPVKFLSRNCSGRLKEKDLVASLSCSDWFEIR